MFAYKILRLRSTKRAKVLDSSVDGSDHGEYWDSLDEALTELGEYGWSIASPIYGPTPGTNSSTWLEAVILTNASPLRAVEWRISHRERLREHSAKMLERMEPGKPAGFDKQVDESDVMLKQLYAKREELRKLAQ